MKTVGTASIKLEALLWCMLNYSHHCILPLFLSTAFCAHLLYKKTPCLVCTLPYFISHNITKVSSSFSKRPSKCMHYGAKAVSDRIILLLSLNLFYSVLGGTQKAYSNSMHFNIFVSYCVETVYIRRCHYSYDRRRLSTPFVMGDFKPSV